MCIILELILCTFEKIYDQQSLYVVFLSLIAIDLIVLLRFISVTLPVNCQFDRLWDYLGDEPLKLT